VLVAVLAGAALMAIGPRGDAHAHPLGNFTTNRYARIELYRDALRVYYVVDYAEIPAFQLLERIDADGDGEMSAAELDAYAALAAPQHAAAMDLLLDTDRLTLTPIADESQALPGQGGLHVLRQVFVYESRVPAGARAVVTFKDNNFAGRAGWREVIVRPSAGASVEVDQRLLTDRSTELLDYPTESLDSVPEVTAASFAWQPGTGETAPSDAGIRLASQGRSNSGFAGLLDRHQSLGIIILSLVAAFGFGALHALGPGHGKTVVAAYLVGSRGTARHALALGLTVTATHTSTVYLLGLVTLTLSELIVPERLYLYLGVASGAMVVVMGTSLLASRLWRAARPQAEGEHRHGFFGKAHSHAPAAPETELHEHAHDLHEHPDHAHATDSHGALTVSWRSLLTLGVAGGLLPCPSAIVVMLAAISIGQIAFGMLLIVAFSLGLAGVLSAIGIVLVFGKRLSGRSPFLRRLDRPGIARLVSAIPLLSAAGVTVAGILITVQAWNQPGL